MLSSAVAEESLAICSAESALAGAVVGGAACVFIAIKQAKIPDFIPVIAAPRSESVDSRRELSR